MEQNSETIGVLHTHPPNQKDCVVVLLLFSIVLGGLREWTYAYGDI